MRGLSLECLVHLDHAGGPQGLPRSGHTHPTGKALIKLSTMIPNILPNQCNFNTNIDPAMGSIVSELITFSSTTILLKI